MPKRRCVARFTFDSDGSAQLLSRYSHWRFGIDVMRWAAILCLPASLGSAGLVTDFVYPLFGGPTF